MGRLLLLYAVGCASGLAAGSPDAGDLFRRAGLPSVSGWVLADFNGDSKFDLATSPAGRYDGRGYAHEVHIRLGESRQSSFTFRSRSGKVRLSARDVDGDHDRDIVILEGWAQEPIGVWLNDGAGNFTEGNLAEYLALLRHHDPVSLQCTRARFGALFAIPGQRVQPALPGASLIEPARMAEGLAPEAGRLRSNLHRSNLRVRAPPRNLRSFNS